MSKYLATVKRKNQAKQETEAVWFIAKKQSGVSFYLADFDEANNAALWCRDRTQALYFQTEQGVYQYIASYLNNRNDIYLIHARKP